jgi:hypothetical protein
VLIGWPQTHDLSSASWVLVLQACTTNFGVQLVFHFEMLFNLYVCVCVHIPSSLVNAVFLIYMIIKRKNNGMENICHFSLLVIYPSSLVYVYPNFNGELPSLISTSLREMDIWLEPRQVPYFIP